MNTMMMPRSLGAAVPSLRSSSVKSCSLPSATALSPCWRFRSRRSASSKASTTGCCSRASGERTNRINFPFRLQRFEHCLDAHVFSEQGLLRYPHDATFIGPAYPYLVDSRLQVLQNDLEPQ